MVDLCSESSQSACGFMTGRLTTFAAQVNNPLLQLTAVIRMLRDVVDLGVLLQQALGEQPGQVTPGGRPSGPLLLLKCPLICEPIAQLHNLQPANCLSMPAQALVWQQCSLLSAVAALK